MQKDNHSHSAMSNHRRVQSSTTLNRKYVKRPIKKSENVTVSIKRSPKVQHFHSPMSTNTMEPQETNDTPAKMHPMQKTANQGMKERKMATRTSTSTRPSAKELKDQAIKKALSSASSMTTVASEDASTKKMHFGVGRVILALSCAAAAVFAIAYFINLNTPDLSLRVAAMQTGIEASYPNYVPRDYSLSGISSENGKITLNFKGNSEENFFSLTEESSPWDSYALLSNFVKETYKENYSIVKEQGLTIYIGDSNAAWVNNRIMFTIEAPKGTLTNKQISTIATSL